MAHTSTDIWTVITTTVTELLAERGEEAGALAPATTISADLGISSVEAIHLLVMMEDRLGMPLSFQDLAVRDGEYAEDLTLGEIAAFVGHAAGAPAASPAQ